MKRYLMAGSVPAGMAMFGACMGLAPGARADIIYNYAFTAGAGYSNGSGDTASLSGNFSWDVTTNSVSASGINLSGVEVFGANPGPISCTNCASALYGPNGQYMDLNPSKALYIVFANGLSNGANDPLALSCCSGNTAEYQDGHPFTNVTGSANIVPAPAIGHGLLVFLAVGGILFGAKFRQRSRNSEAAA
jgi:hypothetical protein